LVEACVPEDDFCPCCTEGDMAVQVQSMPLPAEGLAAGNCAGWSGAARAARSKQVKAGYPQPQQQHKNSEASNGAPPGWFGPSTLQSPLVSMPSTLAPRRFTGQFVPHRLCNHFSAHGWCRKAETCTFAHGLQELHPEVQAQFTPQLAFVPPQAATGKGKGKGLIAKGAGKSGSAVSTTAANAGGEQACSFEFSPDAAPFELNDPNFRFNVGAMPFVPSAAGEDKLSDETGLEETSPGGQDSSPTSDGRTNSGSPSGRRPVPAPLQLEETEALVASPMKVKPLASATMTASPRASVVVHQPLVSPARVQTRLSVGGQSMVSPRAVLLTPTARTYITSPLAAERPGAQVPVPASPNAQIASQLQTPSRGATMVLQSPAGVWPGSPTIVQTPQGQPSTPVPIQRNMLLQARVVVQRLEQGPPGLAHFAPTPTTKASRLGFRYPQPGWVSTISNPPAQAMKPTK